MTHNVSSYVLDRSEMGNASWVVCSGADIMYYGYGSFSEWCMERCEFHYSGYISSPMDLENGLREIANAFVWCVFLS